MLFIPFADIGVSAPSGDTSEAAWRMNLFRIDRHEQLGDEYGAWSAPLSVPISFHTPEEFGYLEFSQECLETQKSSAQ